MIFRKLWNIAKKSCTIYSLYYYIKFVIALVKKAHIFIYTRAYISLFILSYYYRKSGSGSSIIKYFKKINCVEYWK